MVFRFGGSYGGRFVLFGLDSSSKSRSLAEIRRMVAFSGKEDLPIIKQSLLETFWASKRETPQLFNFRTLNYSTYTVICQIIWLIEENCHERVYPKVMHDTYAIFYISMSASCATLNASVFDFSCFKKNWNLRFRTYNK